MQVYISAREGGRRKVKERNPVSSYTTSLPTVIMLLLLEGGKLRQDMKELGVYFEK